MKSGHNTTLIVLLSIFILSIVGITALIVNVNENKLIAKNEATIVKAISYFKKEKSEVTIYEAEQHLKKINKLIGETNELSIKMTAAVEKLYDSEPHANEEEARLNALDQSESVFEEILE